MDFLAVGDYNDCIFLTRTETIVPRVLTLERAGLRSDCRIVLFLCADCLFFLGVNFYFPLGFQGLRSFNAPGTPDFKQI